MNGHFDPAVGTAEHLFDAPQLWRPWNVYVLDHIVHYLFLGLLPITVLHIDALSPIQEIIGPERNRFLANMVQGDQYPIGLETHKTVHQTVPFKSLAIQNHILPQPEFQAAMGPDGLLSIDQGQDKKGRFGFSIPPRPCLKKRGMGLG